LICVGAAWADDYSLVQFLSVQSATAPHFNPTARDLAFTTNISGVPQIWGMSALGSYQKQITFDTNGVAGASWSPTNEKMMIVSAGVGGNERTQLFQLNPYGGPIKRITTDDEAIYRMGPWTPSGEHFAYSTNSRNKKDFDVLEYDLASGTSTILYESEGSNTPAHYSADARYLLIEEAHSSFDTDLLLYDATARASKLLTPHTGNVVSTHPVWDADGKGFYLITDKDREFRGIAYWPIDSASFRWVETPDWDVDEIALSKDGSMLAWTVNENGTSRFGFRDFRRGWDVAPHRVPDGVIDGLEFSLDGRLLAFSLGSGGKPTDVWVYETDGDRMHQVTFSSTGGIPLTAFRDPELIEYPTFDNRKIPAYFYRPPNATGKVPVIIAVHGGPEAQARPMMSGLYQYLLNHGYAILMPNVRGSSGYGKSYLALDNVRKRMDSVKDIEYAERWLTTQKDIDAKKIVLYGGSYGGFMVLSCLATYPDLWAAGVSVVGISSFVTFLENTGVYRRALREAEYGTLQNDSAFLVQISPLTNANAIKAPLMLIQGANDPRVAKSEAEQMAEAIRSRSGVVEYLLFEDEGHGLTKLKNRIAAYSAMVNFLDRYVTDKQTTDAK
jgi:dipeptidyl aminopeptidase/acylaminoacyl peptidase